MRTLRLLPAIALSLSMACGDDGGKKDKDDDDEKKKDKSSMSPELEAFTDSEYNQCDATLIARMWGDSVTETKKWIGEKLKSGSDSSVKGFLYDALDKASYGDIEKCRWSDTGYSYDDAELLSKYWDVSTSDSKDKITYKLNQGDGADVEGDLRRSRRR